MASAAGAGSGAAHALGVASDSELHEEGHMTTGDRPFCKEFLSFNTMLCRRVPLFVHF